MRSLCFRQIQPVGSGYCLLSANSTSGGAHVCKQGGGGGGGGAMAPPPPPPPLPPPPGDAHAVGPIQVLPVGLCKLPLECGSAVGVVTIVMKMDCDWTPVAVFHGWPIV